MKYIKACLLAMKKYCSLPIPNIKQDDELKPLVFLCLPFVGLEIGVLWALIYCFNDVLISAGWFPQALAAILFAAFPFYASGFAHVEGFCGVMDALHAHKDIEDKRKILKEPVVGDFAVISLIFLFFIYYSAALSLTYTVEEFHILIFLPIVTRCCMAISVSVLPPLENSQFAEDDFQKKMTNKRLAFLVIVLIVAAIGATIMTNFYGLVLVAALLGFFYNIIKAYKKLDGMNSEIASYALVKAECWGMIMFALIKPLVNLWTGYLQ